MASVLNSGSIAVNFIGGKRQISLWNPNLKSLVVMYKRCHLLTKTSLSLSSKTQLCNTWSPDHCRIHRLLPAATKLTSWSAPERHRGLFFLRLAALLHLGFCLGALVTNMWLSKERWWLQKGFIIYVCIVIFLAVIPSYEDMKVPSFPILYMLPSLFTLLGCISLWLCAICMIMIENNQVELYTYTSAMLTTSTMH